MFQESDCLLLGSIFTASSWLYIFTILFSIKAMSMYLLIGNTAPAEWLIFNLALPTIAQITLFFISFLFPKNILVLNFWLLKAEPSGILGTTAERVIPACVLFVIGMAPAGYLPQVHQIFYTKMNYSAIYIIIILLAYS